MLRLKILFLLITSFGVSHAYIMGDDDREPVTQTELANSFVQQTGLIRIPGEAFVSGIVTGTDCDIVLSAGHAAIYWQTVPRKGWLKGKLRANGNLTFHIKPEQVQTGIPMQLIHSGFQNIQQIDHDKNDWSVFRLQRPALHRCHNLKIAASPTECNGPLIMPAYHFDRPNHRLMDRTCQIKDVIDDAIIVHDCDSKEGSSGAPLLCQTDEGLKLFAINISGQTSKEYQDPGVYGENGLPFNHKNHRNFAVLIRGKFKNSMLKSNGR